MSELAQETTLGPASGTRMGPRTASEGIYWPGRFQDQVILVTGAAGGLGSDTADRLGREGAITVCTDVTAGGLADGSSPANCLALNVTIREDWDQIIQSILKRYGRIDGALFAHGIQGPEVPITDMPADGWAKTLSVNLDGCLHGLASILPALIQQTYGRVAILSSISAREGNPHQGAYSASKAGLVALVKNGSKGSRTLRRHRQFHRTLDDEDPPAGRPEPGTKCPAARQSSYGEGWTAGRIQRPGNLAVVHGSKLHDRSDS
jgi:hypothetical protein